jgi:hypothetical protein
VVVQCQRWALLILRRRHHNGHAVAHLEGLRAELVATGTPFAGVSAADRASSPIEWRPSVVPTC